MNHPVLGRNLLEISQTLLELACDDAGCVMGYPDDRKLKSCMTLFFLVSGGAVFEQVLEKFFDGELDERTRELLNFKD